MTLKDKVIIVTGGSGLIGRFILDDIRSRGGIAINADISFENEGDGFSFYTDITSEAGVKETLEKVLGRFGRLDGLVNNAYPRTKDWGTHLEAMTLDSWRTNVDIQMNSVFLMVREVLPSLESSKGSIVNIASIYGVVGNDLTLYEGTAIKTVAAYSAIKGGIINFSRYLASYLGRRGIRVNCVSPGGIFDRQDALFVQNYERKVPLGRMGHPDDIAPAVSFLLSDDAKYITGHNLVVDGGWTAI